MVMAGQASASDAAEADGLGPEAAQGIRKRVRKNREREKKQHADEEALQKQRMKKKKKRAAPTDDPPTTKKKPRWRRTAHQTDLSSEDEFRLTAAYNAAYKSATAEYEELASGSGGKRKRGDGSAAAIVTKYNATLPDGALQLDEQTIRNGVAAGNADKSPPRRGPDRPLPKELYATIASFIQMKQEARDEQKSKDLRRTILAALKSTLWEERIQGTGSIKRIMKHVREDFAGEISRANKVINAMHGG
jgi:hypothetical protein